MHIQSTQAMAPQLQKLPEQILNKQQEMNDKLLEFGVQQKLQAETASNQARALDLFA